MKMLACFLLFSMIGGASEVIFIGAQCFLRGQPGRRGKQQSAASDSTLPGTLPVARGATSMEPSTAGPEHALL